MIPLLATAGEGGGWAWDTFCSTVSAGEQAGTHTGRATLRSAAATTTSLPPLTTAATTRPASNTRGQSEECEIMMMLMQ